MKERIQGKTWGGWEDGQLRFRLVGFVVGMGYTQVEMPLDLNEGSN